MRMLTFANRNAKEILRDPLNLGFGLGFPVVLILLLSAIQANVPVPLFEISHLTPGVTVFGLSFMTLFSATIIAKDRGSSLLQRLYTTPLYSKVLYHWIYISTPANCCGADHCLLYCGADTRLGFVCKYLICRCVYCSGGTFVYSLRTALRQRFYR